MAVLCLFITLSSYGQKKDKIKKSDKVKNELPVFYPKNLIFLAGQTVITPSGWGAANNTVFSGATVVTRQIYTDEPDGTMVFGVGLGNQFKTLGLELSTRMNDISTQGEYSYAVKAHRYLGKGTSVAVGAMHLFPAPTTDGIQSYYVSLSHALQFIPSKIPGVSLINLNVGVGNGMFARKSALDRIDGKGSKGTYVFGSLAYNLFLNHSLIAEWSGTNLHMAINSRPFKRFPFFLKASFVDLTTNSGDGVRFVLSSSIAYTFR
jgi:hypothetical protein